MKSVNVIYKLVPLVVFAGLIGQAHAGYFTPPWSKDAMGTGASRGPQGDRADARRIPWQEDQSVGSRSTGLLRLRSQ